ncbi:MAG: site-specific integrase [bacterium]
MSNEKIIPLPLFDTIENINEPTPNCVKLYLTNINLPGVEQEFELGRKFLDSYSGSYDTFNAYRREIERFLHWCWLISKKIIKNIDRNDIKHYFDFSQQPLLTWITTKNIQRFIIKDGTKIHNTGWRPFVVRISKAKHKQGNIPDKNDYSLSNNSIAALIAVLSTFFTFLQQESYIEVNPVQLVRQKKRYIQKQQTHRVTRKLSQLQWQYVVETIENLANNNIKFERHLFLMAIFYLLGLRISEVAGSQNHTPTMSDFAPDKNSRWWFSTVGKGNKARDVAVPDALLEALKRYRTSCNLSPLPSRGESTPLLNKDRGHGNLGTRQVRNLVQQCFDYAIKRLRNDKKEDTAQDLEAATVHWLRHTAISADIEHRPREHVRDDVGHESSTITDRYIDIDRIARHNSAKNKQLK